MPTGTSVRLYLYTTEEMRTLLRAQVGKPKQGRTQTELARRIGIGVKYLNDVLQGRRAPQSSQKILDYLGIERVVVFRGTRHALRVKCTRPRRT